MPFAFMFEGDHIRWIMLRDNPMQIAGLLSLPQ